MERDVTGVIDDVNDDERTSIGLSSPSSVSISAAAMTTTPVTMTNAAGKRNIHNPYKRTVSMLSGGSESSSGSSSIKSSCSSTSFKDANTIYNPYQKKQKRYPSEDSSKTQRSFVGGAELARRLARKKKRTNRGTMISRPGDAERLQSEVLPKNMNPMERFFSALLRSPAQEYIASSSDVWEAVCHRVGLTVPTQPVRATYDNVDTHFEVRAALVLEEARHAIWSGLQSLVRQNNTTSNSLSFGSSKRQMILRAHYIEMIPNNQHSKISFISEKNASFAKEQLHYIRPGSVFACMPRDLARNMQNVILGVVTTANREQIESKPSSFQVVVFRDLPSRSEDAEWVVIPIAALITELRCFEAMTNKPKSIGFLNDLLGPKKRTHIRFDPGGDVESGGVTEMAASSACSSIKPTVPSPGFHQEQQNMFRIPRLNAVQEQAATSFLRSAPNTISLVQGPPGTGKTTFLVNVICQYVLESHRLSMASGTGKEKPSCQRRLLVCAPTNKAVSVLVSRFLNVMNQDSYPCNVILAGDAEKLLMDKQGDNSKGHGTKLPPVATEHRNISTVFLYSWMQALMEEYATIQKYFSSGSRATNLLSREGLHLRAKRLEQRLTRSLRDLPRDVLQLAHGITVALQRLKDGGHSSGSGLVVSKIGALMTKLAAMPQDTIWKELMRSADVIFCTLASSGGMQFIRTNKVDDLIVDEAAAAAEPELCIPFHLKPSRLLAVGDPKQLPATVLSQRAVGLGYSKSLHERLMYECSFDYTLLDTQYRMNPLISSFPSRQFYNSKIRDGDNVEHASFQLGSLCPLLLDKAPYTCLQVNGSEEQGFGGSYRNHAEAKVVAELVSALRSIAEPQNSKWHSPDRIRIITFYQAQVGLIKNLLQKEKLDKKIVVATVDSSQGCEADLVIVSFVRSPSKTTTTLSKYDAGFLTDDRRMNVALTRAKHQLICIGNIQALRHMQGATTLQQLVQDATVRRSVRPYLTSRNNSDAFVVSSSLDLFYGPTARKNAKR